MREPTSEPAEVAAELLDFWEQRGWRTFDPYDGLSTPLVRRPERCPRFLRLGFVHLHKRSVINLRPLFRIEPTRNAYASACFARAALRLRRVTGDDRFAQLARALLASLVEDRVRGGWSYPFTVQTKNLFYDRSTPNVVSTALGAWAFVEAYEALDDERYLAIAQEAARFLISEFLVSGSGPSWFGYIPRNDRLIHNANLLAARICLAVGTEAGRHDLVDIAQETVGTTLSYLRDDGSIAYGVGEDLAWIDNHHTGFVVECLSDIARTLPVQEAVESSASFYERHLFEDSGAPCAAPNRPFPRDSIASAQGVFTFSRLGLVRTAERICSWMMHNMRTRNGTFRYQIGRAHRKSIPYARWCDAHVATGLAAFASASGARD